VDEEFQELANAASNSGNTLLFGRVTYELMVGFWPTAEAIRTDPIVAAGMNKAEKSSSPAPCRRPAGTIRGW